MYQFLIKKPIFSIGVLVFIIFLFQLKQKGYFEKRNKMFTASSCNAILVKIDKIKPKDWVTSCSGHFADRTDTLEVSAPFTVTDPKLDIRVFAYREMANHLSYISKNAPSDNLEKLSWVKISVIHSKGQADGVTSGKLLSRMRTLQTNDALMEHLRNSVKVKDSFK